MGEKPNNPDSLFTLPVVLGVIVVLGGIAATVVSGLFVYRAHAVNVETQRMQASLHAELASEALEQRVGQQNDAGATADEAPQLPAPSLAPQAVADDESTGITVTTLKPGVRLQAQRPAHWDQAEIVDILEDHKIKVRWLSGEPGEDVIAAELVRSEVPPTQQGDFRSR